jgi:hypothetical protein
MNEQTVRRYIEERLPDATLDFSHTEDTMVVTVHRNGCEYSAKFEPEFLAMNDAQSKLDDWKLIEELCRAEGLGLVVTPRGIRLSSSN